jgi:hypothetical protein
MYLATNTRPDINYCTSVLSRFLANPSPQHIAAARRCLQYLAGSIHLCICYGGDWKDDEAMALRGYVDADFAGDRSERKSHTGCVYLFCGGVIVSISKRQPTVAVATTEAEYVAMFKAAQEGAWLRQVFKELGYKKKDA